MLFKIINLIFSNPRFTLSVSAEARNVMKSKDAGETLRSYIAFKVFKFVLLVVVDIFWFNLLSILMYRIDIGNKGFMSRFHGNKLLRL